MSDYLRREADSFVFRRRIPNQLQARFGRKELYRSLGTIVRKIARARAAELFVRTEELFRAMEEDEEYVLTDEDIRAAVRYSFQTDRWRARLRKSVDERSPGELRASQNSLPESLMVPIAPENGVTELDIMIMEASDALEDSDFHGRGAVLNRTRDIMLEMLREYVDRRIRAVFQPETIENMGSHQREQIAPLGAIQLAPRLSTFISGWHADIVKGYNGNIALKDETTDQYLKSVMLFIAIVGDHPVNKITYDIAARFREEYLKLPASHGKSRTGSIKKELAVAKNKTDGPRVTMKTAKRQFSGLHSIWKWLVFKKQVPPTPNPFAGHSFPGTKSKKSARDDWSQEDLQLLLTSKIYREAPRSSALHWLPLLSLFSGMRLEEICRLRPDTDIVVKDRTLCFDIAVRDGWDPKTEAGSRIIPVHSWLIHHGLEEFVNEQKANGADHLFSPELFLRDNKLSKDFSRDFSKIKIGLGVSSKTAFHSFRHTFRTVLESTDLKESHIDAVMGHEGQGSEGRTYSKRVTTAKLKEVVEAFTPPIDFAFLELPTSGTHWTPPKIAVKKRKLVPPSFDESGKLIRSTTRRKR